MLLLVLITSWWARMACMRNGRARGAPRLQEGGEVGGVLMLAGQDAVALLKLQAVEHLRACAGIMSAHDTFSLKDVAPTCVQS